MTKQTPKPVQHVVHGDWRDLRAAIEAVDENWDQHTREERAALWDFAKGVVENHPAMKGQCVDCRGIFNIRRMYRCADCDALLCESHIRPHFGPGHKPHPTSPALACCWAEPPT